MMLLVLPREGGVTGQKKDDWTGGIWTLILEEFKNNARIGSPKPPLVRSPAQSTCVLSRFRKHAGNRTNTLSRILIFEMCVHLSGIRGIRQHALYLSHDTDVVKLHANVTVLLFRGDF